MINLSCSIDISLVILIWFCCNFKLLYDLRRVRVAVNLLYVSRLQKEMALRNQFMMNKFLLSLHHIFNVQMLHLQSVQSVANTLSLSSFN